MTKNKRILLYGATWCMDCNRAKQYFDDNNVDYDFINIDEDPEAADKVVEINKGLRSIPTIVFPGGAVLVEPSNEQLQKAIDADKEFTVIHDDKKNKPSRTE